MASSKEKMVAEMFEKLVFKDTNDDFQTLDPVQKKSDVYNKLDDESNQEKNKVANDVVEPSKSANVKFDENSFLSSQFEEGGSSKQDEGIKL